MSIKNFLDLLRPPGRLTYRSREEMMRTLGFLSGVAIAVNLPRDMFENARSWLWRTFVERDLYYHGVRQPVQSVPTDLFTSEVAVMRLIAREKAVKHEMFSWLRS